MPAYQKLDLNLQETVSEIKEGTFQLPEFQRKFKWKQSEQTSLLASIQKNYPVGSVLLLEIAPVGELPFAVRPFSGVVNPVVERPRYLVLDGQQRLTTCFQALSGVGNKRAVIDLKKLFEAVTSPHANLALDFEEFIKFEKAPLHLDQLLLNKHCLPFPFILDRPSLRQNLRSYRDGLLGNPGTEGLGRFVDNELEMHLDVFFEYMFPAVILPSSLDLEAIANVFTKINTTGLRLSAFDLCVASLFPKNISLRSLWELAVENDQISRFGDDGTELLQAIALASNVNSRKASLFSVLKDHHINGHWESTVKAYKSVADSMEEIGVSGAKTLPYSGVLPVLIAATNQLPVANTPPEKELRKNRMAKYIFHTAFKLRYTEGLDSKREEDFQKVVNYFRNGIEPEFMADRVPWDNDILKLGRNGARSSAIMAILNRTKPNDLINHDRQVAIGRSGFDSAEVHHIFPKAYLATIGRAEDSDRALNCTLLTRESNNFISDRRPSIYLNQILDQISIGQNLSQNEARERLLVILSNHLINAACLEALLNDDYDSFLEARSSCIASYVEGMGIELMRTFDSSDGELDEDEELE